MTAVLVADVSLSLSLQNRDPCASQNVTIVTCSPEAGLVSLDSTDTVPVGAQHIVIDCSAFPYVDSMGVEILKQVSCPLDPLLCLPLSEGPVL